MERAEAIKIIKTATVYTPEEIEALETLIPELKESEDERIRKGLIEALKASKTVGELKFIFPEPTREECITWLEKQEEQPQEELVYRMNGLMQEYIKEGKDAAEKEHRFKCYQLFWDALEDANFFEQKEQKPADDKAFEKWIDEWWKHNKVNNPDSYDKGDEIQFDKRGFKNFCRGIRNMYAEQKPAEINVKALLAADRLASAEMTGRLKERSEILENPEKYGLQKPAEWDELQAEFRNINEAFEDGKKEVVAHPEKYGLCKPADEQFPPLEGLDAIKAKYYDDGFKNGFDEGVDSVKPAEWSEEDKKQIRQIERIVKDAGCSATLQEKIHNWLKSLRPSWKPSKRMLNALKWAKSEFHPDCPETMEQLNYLYTELKKIYYDGN